MGKSIFIEIFFLLIGFSVSAQLKWENVDSLFQPLPSSVHVYYTNDSLDGKPNIAYYLIADLKDKKLDFTVDTTYKRRLTPTEFFEKNDKPLIVVNTTFFSFETNQNLNVVIKDGKLVSYNIHSIPGRGKDTLTYRHPFGSALGISKKRKADIAWVLADTGMKRPQAMQWAIEVLKDSVRYHDFEYYDRKTSVVTKPHEGRLSSSFKEWKMKTAVGGGPVLLQNGEIKITNNEELKFTGKAVDDKHPRTAMGYTNDGKLVILVIQGRFPGISEGATLKQEAMILKNLGCIEALNMDGGGSSCLLINGKQTIQPSDKQGQRAVPAIFSIK